MEFSDVLFAFGLTLFAGLATCIGGALAYFTRQTNTKVLSLALGFSAGVMIYVSMIEIFFKAKASLSVTLGDTKGAYFTVIAFFGGMLLIGIIDRLVPTFGNPHEAHDIEELYKEALCLPCSVGLSQKDQDRVIESIKMIYKQVSGVHA